jgi:ribosomal protein S18 acetylase RimI-like enzyme
MITIKDMTIDHVEQLGLDHCKSISTIDFLDWETPSIFKNVVRQNRGISKVAIDELTCKIAGFIFGGDTGIRGMLHHLYVLPEYRNKGIADSLISSSLNTFRTNPLLSKRVFGLVYGNNHTMIKILKRNGFLVNAILDQDYPCVIPMYIDL